MCNSVIPGRPCSGLSFSAFLVLTATRCEETGTLYNAVRSCVPLRLVDRVPQAFVSLNADPQLILCRLPELIYPPVLRVPSRDVYIRLRSIDLFSPNPPNHVLSVLLWICTLSCRQCWWPNRPPGLWHFPGCLRRKSNQVSRGSICPPNVCVLAIL